MSVPNIKIPIECPTCETDYVIDLNWLSLGRDQLYHRCRYCDQRLFIAVKYQYSIHVGIASKTDGKLRREYQTLMTERVDPLAEQPVLRETQE